jgi:hypothetical protein
VSDGFTARFDPANGSCIGWTPEAFDRMRFLEGADFAVSGSTYVARVAP